MDVDAADLKQMTAAMGLFTLNGSYPTYSSFLEMAETYSGELVSTLRQRPFGCRLLCVGSDLTCYTMLAQVGRRECSGNSSGFVHPVGFAAVTASGELCVGSACLCRVAPLELR